jgi:hypothetical protein
MTLLLLSCSALELRKSCRHSEDKCGHYYAVSVEISMAGCLSIEIERWNLGGVVNEGDC